MYWMVNWALGEGGGRKRDGGGMEVLVVSGEFRLCWATPWTRVWRSWDCVVGADSFTVEPVAVEEKEEADLGDEKGVLNPLLSWTSSA